MNTWIFEQYICSIGTVYIYKIVYFYILYASIQLYTQCILETTVTMFVFKYHNFRCYISNNVLKCILKSH